MTFKKLLLAIALSIALPAKAQTYVRPSKGKSITLFNSPVTGPLSSAYAIPSTCTGTSAVGCTLRCKSLTSYCISSVIDMSSFAGFNISVNRADSALDCKYGIRTTITNSTDPSGASSQAAQTRNGSRNSLSDDSWYVATTSPYVVIKLDTFANPAVTTTTCTGKVSIVVTPAAFDPTGVNSTTSWSWNKYGITAPVCATVPFSGLTPFARLQNLGNKPIKCGFQAVECPDPSYPSCPNPTDFPIYLKADSTQYPNSTGDGGVMEVSGFQNSMYCCVVGAALDSSALGVFQH